MLDDLSRLTAKMLLLLADGYSTRAIDIKAFEAHTSIKMDFLKKNISLIQDASVKIEAIHATRICEKILMNKSNFSQKNNIS